MVSSIEQCRNIGVVYCFSQIFWCFCFKKACLKTRSIPSCLCLYMLMNSLVAIIRLLTFYRFLGFHENLTDPWDGHCIIFRSENNKHYVKMVLPYLCTGCSKPTIFELQRPFPWQASSNGCLLEIVGYLSRIFSKASVAISEHCW